MIPVALMPEQVGVRRPQDDWTGIIDRTERRKLQNRINQRSYPLPSTAILTDLWGVSMLARPTLESYLKNSPNQDHLLSLPKFNIQCAIIDNTVAMGMTMEWMNDNDAVSIFNMQGPNISEAHTPASLRPTIVQRRIPHHPWLDFFPFPNMRDNLIAVQDEIDDEELCHDLMAFWDTRNADAMLLVWGPSWVPGNWEMTPAFVKKWGFLLGGCEELLQSTNSWRVKRGERPLSMRPLFQDRLIKEI
ncbi:hypothetical protein BDV33DRAFT_233517 [Aspergillus novoparasiticus]|uniref:Uncharacterized protein n=1 Tax=Aspergillus novoparasiticus TaxID=986946 RepID=A0A5N6EFV3_9EURO|nr:hypothetical protein BDV33DRAFT_233517 [Aspergillus novoparasiticus]